MNRKIFVIGLVILSGAIGFFLWNKNRSSQKLKLNISRGNIVEAVYGLGRVVSAKTYEYKTGVTTQMTSVFISEGQPVKKGQKLLSIETGGVVVAPFAGTITGLYYQEGENITPSTKVLSLTDLTHRYILVSLDQQGALKVKPNLKARISFESIRDKMTTGIVTSVYSNSQGEFAVRIDTNEYPDGILPGMTADVAIIIQEKENVLLAPASAIKDFNISISQAGKVKKIPVKTGLIDGELVEITEGQISEGDEVIIDQGK